jgi:hypothetical protein
MRAKDYLESLTEWKNDERMSSLFYLEDVAHFKEFSTDDRLRVTNKVNFWNSLVPQLLQCEDSPYRLVCDLKWMECVSERKGLRPQGLIHVAAQLCQDTRWMSLETYLKKYHFTWPTILNINEGHDIDHYCSSHKGWIQHTVSWAWSHLKMAIFGKSMTTTTCNLYIQPLEVQKVARGLMEDRSFVYYTDRICSLHDIKELLEKKGVIAPLDVMLVVMELQFEKQLYDVCSFGNQERLLLIKWMRYKEDKINETDKGLFKIKVTWMKVQKQLEDLKHQVTICQTHLREELLKNHRQAALLYLRKQKSLEQCLIKRQECEMTLERLWLSIQTSETDGDLLKAYEAGSNTLKWFMQEHGITVEHVQDALETLEATMVRQEDIEQAISTTAIMANGDPNDMEIELDRLIDVVNKEQWLRNAPSPPKDVPLDVILSDVSERLQDVQITDNV